LRAARRIGLECRAPEEQELPGAQKAAQVEREAQRMRLVLGAHRLARHDEGVQRLQVLIAEQREVFVGKRRIEMAPFPVQSLTHRAHECGLGPAADAGVRIGRDVSAVQRAEGGMQRLPAGECLAARGAMAHMAVSDRGKVGAFRDQCGIE
jgi:hypothetical protein